MRSDRPAPIVVEQAPRDLPETRWTETSDTPAACQDGLRFVDELYRERRISSVEWRLLRDAIWPLVRDPNAVERDGSLIPLFRLAEPPTNSSEKRER